jgi:hypothetical protein
VSEFEDEQEYEREPAPNLGPLKSSRPITIAIFLLALMGFGAAFLWHEYGGSLIFKSETTPPVVSLKAFEEYKQTVDASQQRDHELLKVRTRSLRECLIRFCSSS